MTLSDIIEKKKTKQKRESRDKTDSYSKLLRYNSPLLIEHVYLLCRKSLTIANNLRSPLDLAEFFYGYLF